MSGAAITDLVRNEDGGVIVFVGLLFPVVALFLALTVDIGNWWVHKRHLQTQVDAAALAGGARFSHCFPDPSVGNAVIAAEATRFGGGPGSSYNAQVSNTTSGTVGPLLYQSKTYPAGSAPPDDTDERPPCESLQFDVKASETDLPLLFQIPGLSSIPQISAHARVELKKVRIFEGMLPLAVPEVRPRHVTATFVDESGVAVGPPLALTGPTAAGDLASWTGTGVVPVLAGRKLGVRIGIGQNPPTCAAANGDGGLGYSCFDASNYSTGLVAISGFSSVAVGTPLAPTRASFEVWPVTSCSGSPFFSDEQVPAPAATCAAAVQAVVRTTTPIDPALVTTFTAQVRGSGLNQTVPFTYSGGVWSTPYSFPIPLGGGKYDITLRWAYTGGSTLTFSNVQQFYSGGGDSGPIRFVSLTGASAPATTAYSQPEGLRSVTVNVTLQGNLQLTPTTETVLLRLTSGSRTSAVACDGPGFATFRASIVNGCQTPYQINEIGYCPDPADPTPADCVPTQTGDGVGPTLQGLDQRFAACPPYEYPNYDAESDPRVVMLMVTDLSALSGSGTTDIPVLNFAAFYIGGWSRSTCANNSPEPPGLRSTDRAIWGHFVFYARPNPQNASDEICDPTLVTPCVPVMTR